MSRRRAALTTFRDVQDLVFLTASVRRALNRPAVRRTALLLVAVTTIVIVATILRAAGAARDRWGETRPVVIAREALVPGDVVDRAAVEVRRLPAALVSDQTLETAPIGSTVRYPVAAGEPLLPLRLAPQGVQGTAALVPTGQRAVTVPAGPAGAPPLRAGDLVDVLVVAGLAPGPGHVPRPSAPMRRDRDGAETAPAFTLVADARVIDVADERVTLAVPAPDAPRVAYAASSGAVALALTGH